MTVWVSDSTRLMYAKRDGSCGHCGKKLLVGDEIKYNFVMRYAFCPSCEETSRILVSTSPGNIQTIPIGYYVVIVDEPLDNLHGKCVLRVYQPKKGGYAGRTMIQRHKERGNYEDDVAWHNVAFYENGRVGMFMSKRDDALLVKAIHTLTHGDHDTYSLNFAIETGRCRRCGRLLTAVDTIQRFHGYGGSCFQQLFGVGKEKSEEKVTIWVL